MIRMFDRTRRARVVLAVLVMASLTIVTIDFRSQGEGPLDKLGRVALTVIGPVQEGLVRVFRPVGDFFSGFTQVGSLRNRIGTLERENAGLKSGLNRVEDVSRENANLRKLLGLQERFDFRTLPVQVIGVSPSNFERTVFIDKGRGDGIRRDMPVLAGDGLAGRVVSVGASVSQVLLIVDRSSAVAARVASSGETGVLEGRGSGPLRFELLDPNARVAEGDKIVTAGYDRGLYPPGVPIGTVVNAPAAGPNLTRVVQVEPAVDFSRLDHLLVILGKEGGP